MELMDRELSVEYKRKQRVRLYLTVVIVFILSFVAFVSFRSFIRPSIERSEIVTAIAEIGVIEATINASGVVVPEYELIIVSPINGKIEKVIHNAGESVNAGESIIQLNKESTVLQYDQLKNEQEVNKNQKDQLKLNLDKSLNDLSTQYLIKELKIKSLETALDQENELFKVGGSTKENVKQAELNLIIAKQELKQLEKLINNQKATMNVELKSLGFQMKIKDKNIKEVEKKLKTAEISSPRKGVVTWVEDKIGSTVAEGKEVARVADLSSFKIEGSISDSYANDLKVGGDVIIKANEKELRGTISNIKPSVENGIIKFIINLKNKNDSVLRSNAKVDVYVITSFKDKAIRVKNGSGFSGSEEQVIFIVKNGEALARKVKIGESNFDHIEIKSGVKPGDEIITSDMQEYIQHERLLIK